MPEPYISPEGFHRHRCEKCGYIWEHEDRDRVKRTDEENCTVHFCPKCGTDNWGWRYQGDSPPDTTTRK